MTQVTFNGKTYTLAQDAHYSNGNEDEYQANAIDDFGNDCTVYWNIKADINRDTAEESDMCDWGNPVRVDIYFFDNVLDMIAEKAKETGIDYDYYYQFTIAERRNIDRAYKEDYNDLIEDRYEELKSRLEELENEYRNAEKQEGGK